MKLIINEGAMWEGGTWYIKFNVKCVKDTETKPCKHCSPVWIQSYTRFDGSTWQEELFTCPRVIVAENEGGCATTGVCLDCILETTLYYFKSYTTIEG